MIDEVTGTLQNLPKNHLFLKFFFFSNKLTDRYLYIQQYVAKKTYLRPVRRTLCAKTETNIGSKTEP